MKYLCACMAVVALFGACSKKKSESPQRGAINDLPAMMIATTTGDEIFTKHLRGKTILILFQPDCDHCQREAKQIHDNLSAFQGYEMYFISTATLEELKKFSTDYQF